MARARGSGGRGTKPGRGHGRGGKRSQDATGLPRRTGEVGACAELGSNVFTLSANNKAKDGDQLRKTKDALALYIGRIYGEESGKEFELGKLNIRLLPTMNAGITARHAAKVVANTTRITAKIASLTTMRTAITAAILADPTQFDLIDKSINVQDKLEKSRQELLDLLDSDVSSVMTMNEEAIHKNAFRSFHDDEQKLIVNRGKVYVLILGQCTQVLKDALKEDDDWTTISEEYDAIALFELIEKCVLKQTSNKYHYLILQEEWRSLLLCKQESDHTTNAYYERMSNRVTILERAGGIFHTPELLEIETELLYSTQKYDAITEDERQKVRAVVKEKYLATLFLDRSDKKHDQLKDDIKNKYAQGDKNAFPTTISGIMQLMQNYRRLQPEKAGLPAQGTAFAQAGGKVGKGGDKKSPGRLSNEEWWALTPEARTKLDKERKAAKAADGEKKTKSKSKDKKDNDDDDRSIASLQKKLHRSESNLKNMTKCLVNITESNESDLSDEEGSNNLLAECTLQDQSPMLGAWYAQVKKSGRLSDLDLRNEFLLDSQCTHNLCCNSSYVSDIRGVGRALNMGGNAGMLRITRKAKIKGLYPKEGAPSQTWFDERCITNLLAFKELIKVYRITYDSDVDTSFTVHRQAHGLVDLHFRMHESGLHILVRSELSGQVFVQTVEENMSVYTRREVEKAKKARELYEYLIYPGVEDYCNIIRTGGIKDCTVTLDDARRSFKIFGPHVMKGKGNAVRKTNKFQKDNIVEVPRELIEAQREVVLNIDMFFINKHTFITTYSDKVCYTTTSHVSSKGVRHYWPFLLQVLQKYAARGLVVVRIRGDFEFNGIMGQVALLIPEIILDLSSENEHIGAVERNIRYIKEKARSIRVSLPFDQIPSIMVIYMVLQASKILNLFPRKGGVPHYSPNVIMKDEGVSMNQFRLPFGAYVQVKESSTQSNSLQARTRGAISLGMMENSTGGGLFMALDTMKVIRRSQWTVHPVTAEVKTRVEELGKEEPRMLTWYNRHGEVIGDNATLWDSADTSARIELTEENDKNTRNVLEAREEDLPDLTEEEEDHADVEEDDPQDTYLDVANDITGVDPLDKMVEEQGQVVQGSDAGGDAIEQQVRPESRPVESVVGARVRGVTPTQVVTPSERPVRERRPPKPAYEPSMTGKKYGMAMATIMTRLKDKSADDARAYMQQELWEAGEHHQPEVMGVMMVQLSMKAATTKFGVTRTDQACKKEIKQIHLRDTFVPKHYHELLPQQKQRILEAFIFVEQKKDGSDKARLVINGAQQRGHITKDEASSPTAYNESIMLTSVIDAQEGRDVATVDIPNAFVQTVVAESEKDYRVLVRLRGRIVEILCEIAPEVYLPFVTTNKKGERILLVQCMNALYGTMVASLLYYKKFVKSLKREGFTLNPYDPCVANKTVGGKVLTVCFHVDDCKISHRSSKVVDETIEWLRKEYEVIFEDGSGAMKIRRGKIHDYIGVRFDFTTKGEVHLTMPKHLEDVAETFDKTRRKVEKGFVQVKRSRSKKQMTPAPTDIFIVNEECEKLSEDGREIFHCLVAKMVFIWKRVKPDCGVAMSFLTKRVKEPDLDDWRKLVHLMDYLKADGDRPLILAADKSGDLTWYVDAAFAVHANGRSHTGGGLTMRKGFIISISAGQKLTTRSSTEGEIVAVDDCMSLILWAREFLLAQGFQVRRNIILQDNMSSILLEKNGRASSGKRMRHINIRYYFVADRSNKGECEIEWTPGENMVADYLTKGLQGREFRRFRDVIMGSAELIQCIE